MTLQLSRETLPDVRSLSRTGWASLVLAALAVVLAIIGGVTADSTKVDGYGIVFALAPIYWVGVGLGAIATTLLLRAAVVERTRYAATVPPMWLGILHTAPHLAHDHFRFHTAYTHLGFVRVIEETGSGDVLIDARFAWPGFFGVFMAPLSSVNDSTLELFMRLWPTAILGATAILVSALANRAYPTVPLIGPLSATVYILLAWTGQDYFSPQSFGYTAYLTMLVLLESGPLRTSPAWSASVPFLARFAAAGGERPEARTRPVTVALIILSFGSIVSHPLAPFFICMGMVIMALYGRTVAWRLLFIIGVAYVVWFFITSEPWWSTQLPTLLSQVGDLFNNADSTTTDRIVGSSPERQVVASVRTWIGLGTFLSVLGIGVTMATERFRHLRPAVPLAPLAGIPSIALVLASYGGEIIFRVVLFTLPIAAVLIGRVLASVRVRALPILVPVLVLALIPVLMLARFGNESFEMASATDRQVIEAGYARAQDDTLFVLDNGFAPFMDRTIGRNNAIAVPSEPSPEWLAKIEEWRLLAEKERVIILFTPTQTQWRVHGMSSSPDYLANVADWLSRQPGTTVLFEQDGGWVIEL
jgi:hypothetical protein